MLLVDGDAHIGFEVIEMSTHNWAHIYNTRKKNIIQYVH